MSDLASNLPATHTIARKTIRGAASLGGRQLFVQGTRIAASIFLARILTPAEFGVYAIILYLQTFLIAFGDAGLAGSLIRQHEEPHTEDYRAIFTLQQIFVTLLSCVLWISAGWIAARYHLRASDAWLFRLVALSFLATSFMVIPQIKLERHLEFHKVALIDSAQAIIFNGTAVLLAIEGFGSYSFAWALLLRAISGSVLANWISPWAIGWRWDWPRIKDHLSFGIPYQGIQVASLVKDSITPFIIGMSLGTAEVGYVSWAVMVAAYPVMALMVLQRVYMPAFARLQKHTDQLAALVENVIWATNAIAAPLSIITLVMIYPMTTILFGQKWLVAIPLFYFFWLANLFVPTATPALSLLSAVGKSQVAFGFSLVWMAGTWIVGVPLIAFYGAKGFAIANLVIQFSNLLLFRSAKRCIRFRIMAGISPVWILAIASGLLLSVLHHYYAVDNIFKLGSAIAFYLAAYGAGIAIFYRERLKLKWESIRKSA
jgi:O-antigen/teichoic acid export membrane protein